MTLAKEISENYKVLIATSTHMYPPPCRVLISPGKDEILAAFEHERIVAVGSMSEHGKFGSLPELQSLYPALADAALVEADGSRGLPLKAPAENEPVIPKEARMVVALMGLDGIGNPIAHSVHRPERYAALLGKSMSSIVTPEDAAAVLTSRQGQMKNVNCDFAVVLNKADNEGRIRSARKIASMLPYTVLITALIGKKLIEIWRDGNVYNN